MNITSKIGHITTLAMTILFIFQQTLKASPVTIQITGTVTSASGYGLPDTITVGSILTGTYRYDSLAPDSDASPNRGRYEQNPPYGICVFLGGYEFRTAPERGFSMQIWNDFTDSLGRSYDWYRVSGIVSALPDIPHCNFGWSLTDYTQKALSSPALPGTSPILADWTSNHFQLMYGNVFLMDGIVTHAVLIPEPATLLLLGAGGIRLRQKRCC